MSLSKFSSASSTSSGRRSSGSSGGGIRGVRNRMTVKDASMFTALLAFLRHHMGTDHIPGFPELQKFMQQVPRSCVPLCIHCSRPSYIMLVLTTSHSQPAV